MGTFMTQVPDPSVVAPPAVVMGTYGSENVVRVIGSWAFDASVRNEQASASSVIRVFMRDRVILLGPRKYQK